MRQTKDPSDCVDWLPLFGELKWFTQGHMGDQWQSNVHSTLHRILPRGKVTVGLDNLCGITDICEWNVQHKQISR